MLQESVACAFDSDGGAVERPIEEHCRDDGPEDIAPFREASVQGGDHRAFFCNSR